MTKATLIVDVSSMLIAVGEKHRPEKAAVMRSAPVVCGHAGIILGVLGPCGYAKVCTKCMPGYAPGRCPVCRGTGAPCDFGDVTMCERCLTLFVADAGGELRIIPDSLLDLVQPDFEEAVKALRHAFAERAAKGAPKA